MSVIKNAMIASTALFAFGCITVHYLDRNAERIISQVAIRAMDDPEVIEAVYEYTNKIVEKTLNDLQVYNKFNLFVNKLLMNPEVTEGVKKLIKKSLMDAKMLMSFANEVLNEIKKRGVKAAKDSAKYKMINESFQWNYKKFENNLIHVEKLKEVLDRTKEFLPRVGFKVARTWEREFFLMNTWKVVGAKIRGHSTIYNEFGGYMKGVRKDFLRIVRKESD